MRQRATGRRLGSGKIRHAILEALEARQLLSVDMVTNANDTGAGCLRQVIANASSGDTIEFAANLTGDTISLQNGVIALTKNLTIIGLGEGNLSISGNLAGSVFTVASGVTVSMSNLEIEEGYSLLTDGGGINNQGTLSLAGCEFNEDIAEYGGGIYNLGGTVTLNYCSMYNCEAEQGAAILNAGGGTITVTGSTIGSNESYEAAGGGICNENSTLTVIDSTVSENFSDTYGGGIANESDGILIVNDSVVQSNTAFGWGGGIFNFAGASLTVENGSLIEGNNSYSDFGGGVFNEQGTATITDSTVTGNNDDYAGGGAGNFLGTLTITGSTFSTNGSGNTDQELGGGVWAFGGTTTISSSTFNANEAIDGAGIYGDQNSDIIISACTFQNNDATDDGGGVEINGTAYISNSTFAGNQAQLGAGILADGTLTVVNTTISSNVSIGGSGAGIYVSGGDATLWNTIVAGNTITGTTASDISGALDADLANGQTPSSNNLIGTGGSGGLSNGTNGNIVGSTNPGLGSLQNNGGSLLTMALQSSSPAINAGNNSLAVDSNGNPLTTDERGAGYPRIVGGTVDIGAYELQTAPAVELAAGESSAALSNSPFIPASPIPAPPRPAASVAQPNFVIENPSSVADANPPYSPSQIASAYGINAISFKGTAGTGAGQTIAIVDAYNDPDIIADANTFSNHFNLPQFNVSGGPTLTILGQTGTSSLPSDGDPGNWDVEESLDVEWAHAIAPQANIVVFEANSDDSSDLYAAVATAADYSGVCDVSMSWGIPEIYDYLDSTSQSSTDSIFTTPAGHQGVTFIASTGDSGAPAVSYPGISPNVLAAGGTSLEIGTDGSYQGESAWSDGGGGVSLLESQPSFQNGNVNGASSANRVAPDVSFDADPESGVEVLDTYYTPSYLDVGGTSVSAPSWAGLIAITDQGRLLNGLSTLDGATQTLPGLYSLPGTDFHDVTSGDNGYAATSGYDPATGLGSPIANLLIPALAGTSNGNTLAFAQQPAAPYAGGAMNGPLVVDVDNPMGGVDSNDNSNVSLVLASGAGTLNGTLTVQAHNGVATFNGLWFSTAGTYVIRAIDGTDTVATSMNFTVGNPPDLSGSGYYFTGTLGALTLNVDSGTVTLSGDLSTVFPNYDLSIEDQAKVVLDSDQNVAALDIVDGNGTLDVTTYSMIINYGSGTDPKSTLLPYLRIGADAGPLTQAAGITSSGPGFENIYGIGYADGADGIDPSLTSGQFEVAYALYGDITLQGLVNGQDFAALTHTFGHVVTNGWEAGDFDYEGSVSGFDFSLLSQNFGETAVTGSAAMQQTDATSGQNSVLSDAPSTPTAAVALATTQTAEKKNKTNAPDVKKAVARVSVAAFDAAVIFAGDSIQNDFDPFPATVAAIDGAAGPNMPVEPWASDISSGSVEAFLRTRAR